MANRSSGYKAKEAADDFEVLSDKLASDLRRSIRQLGSFPLLSEPWLQMAETFGRVATISDVEARLPPSKSGTSGGTLWETEEMALRFLLEDGKLNLCLRNLAEYKAYQHSQFLESREAKSTMVLNEKCNLFEKGLGVILRNAWNHLEVLQTTDLPTLMNYIADVLEFAVANPLFQETYANTDLPNRQELMVYSYMWGMFKSIDDIGEGRIMPIARSRKLFMLGARWLEQYHRLLLGPDVQRAAEALALFAETEDFATHKDKYIESVSDSQCLQNLKQDCLSAFNSDFEAKRKLRPLLDAIDQAKRRHGTK